MHSIPLAPSRPGIHCSPPRRRCRQFTGRLLGPKPVNLVPLVIEEPLTLRLRDRKLNDIGRDRGGYTCREATFWQ